MTGKEKLRKAMAHEDVEVPIDFGSNAVTGIHVSIVEKLREYYGLEWKPVKVNEPYQMLGEVGEELKQILGIDVDGLYPYHTIFGFPNRNWKEWETPWGQLVLVPEDFNVRQEGEDVVIYPQGDAGVPPSGKMPSASFYFDSIIRQHPIDDRALNPEDNLEEFVPITDRELEYYRREAQSLSGSDRAVMANFGGTGLGDIALVPAPFLKNPKGIRDITEWYISTVTRQDSPGGFLQTDRCGDRELQKNLLSCRRDRSGRVSLRHRFRLPNVSLLLPGDFRQFIRPLLQANDGLDPSEHRLEGIQAQLRCSGSVHGAFHRGRF
jgi:hypothetical protein